MRYIKALFIVVLILFADQILKIYVKTHFQLGETYNVVGDWFKLHFIENEGMAWGIQFGGKFGKIFLTFFRLIAVIFGFIYLKKISKDKNIKNLFVYCIALIVAGALGNLIDGLVYGEIFSISHPHGLSQFVPWGQGYSKLFYGQVVDMFYFPLADWYWPKWIPFIGGRYFEFFGAIFNIADASISCAVIILLFFQGRIFPKQNS